MASHPLFDSLRALSSPRPLVVAHRGDSAHHPENTLSAFRAAVELGVPIQEFDVRQFACGTLGCIHDATLDRTSDAARVLGPGALVANTPLDVAHRADAGSWFDEAHRGERIPTLRDALAVMLPSSVPLIEHKAGDAQRYVETLRATDTAKKCIVQSFDWHFVAEVHRLAPEIALGALGPNPVFATPGEHAIEAARNCGAGLLHWRATDLTRSAVERAHAFDLLVCTYTTDDELGWLGGAALGVDAMCTNDPAEMSRAMAQPRGPAH